MTALYRFRYADAVLARFQELERQEIYFAPIEQLNDPMEGYKDVFWRGDSVVWHNLLRHFVLVAMVMAHRLLGGPQFGDADIRRVIFYTADDLPMPPATARQVYADLCAQFLGTTGVASLVEKLGLRTHAMRREELAHYLRALYPFFLHLFFRHPSLKEVVRTSLSDEVFQEQTDRMNRTVETLTSLRVDQVASAEGMFVAGEVFAAQQQIRLDWCKRSRRRHMQRYSHIILPAAMFERSTSFSIIPPTMPAFRGQRQTRRCGAPMVTPIAAWR
jgi:hypothetical protein